MFGAPKNLFARPSGGSSAAARVLNDLDFSLRAAQAGLDCATCNDILVVHEFQANYDEHWRKYAQRFVDKHESRLGPMPVELARPELVSLQLHSAEEWRLLTQHMIGQEG